MILKTKTFSSWLEVTKYKSLFVHWVADFIGVFGPEVAERFSMRKLHETFKSDPWEGQFHEKVELRVKSAPLSKQPICALPFQFSYWLKTWRVWGLSFVKEPVPLHPTFSKSKKEFIFCCWLSISTPKSVFYVSVNTVLWLLWMFHL